MSSTQGSAGAAPKASNFAVTCNLLSQYIKERGSVADLGLPVASSPADLGKGKSVVLKPKTATMSLLPGVDVEDCDGEEEGMRNYVGSSAKNSVTNSSLRQPGKGPLTIFYAGKVLVFNDFPAEKAEDLLNFAGQGTENFQIFGHVTPSPATGIMVECQNAVAKQDAKGSITPVNMNTAVVATQGQADRSAQRKMPELPMTRKASLQRFMERRKERISSTAPYKATGPSDKAIPKSEESKSWLGLSPQVSSEQAQIQNSDNSR